MHTIIPAVIPKSVEHLTSTTNKIAFFTNEIQIDIVDGVFVPFSSWPYTGGTPYDLRSITDHFSVEVDLMVENPEIVINDYVKAGVKRVVIHIESVDDIQSIFEHHRTHEYQLGLSLLNDTSLQELGEYIAEIDFVQLMGIAEIGSQGQPFDTRVLSRIRELRSLFPGLPISIDGSVNKETLPLLAESGADRFIVGSALLNSEDIAGTYKELLAITQKTL